MTEKEKTKDPERFGNLRQMLQWLAKQGYKVSESNLYKHGKESKIRPDPDGTYSIKAVKDYAATWLKTRATYQTEKADLLQQKKETESLRGLKIKNKHEALNLAIKEGKYILRSL